MALSALQKKVARLHELTEQQKAIEEEREGLKAWFRQESGGVDAVFAHKDLEVCVTAKERSTWDSDALNQHFGEKASKYKKTTRYAEVSCRKAKDDAA